MTSPEDLVSFKDPPVHETVLAVGFRSMPGVGAAHFSRFQQSLLPKYSVVEELPAYNMPIERLVSGSPGIGFTLSQGLPPSRTAFVGQEGDRLFQIQRDWFAHNWRQTGEKQYPRYQELRKEFLDGWERFNSWSEQEVGLDPLRVVQAEVSYINHLPALESEGNRSKAPDSLLRLFTVAKLGDGVGELEAVNLRTSALFFDSEGLPVGRLHITFGPSQTRDGKTVNTLNLTARGEPSMGLTEFFDMARRAIVTTFVQLTETELQQQWGPDE